MVSDDLAIQDYIIQFYTNLFSAPKVDRDFSKVKDLISHLVSHADNILLLKVPLDLEIKEVVFSMDPHSALGLDRFTSLFYKKCWDFIGPNVCSAIKYFL